MGKVGACFLMCFYYYLFSILLAVKYIHVHICTHPVRLDSIVPLKQDDPPVI